MESDSTDRTVPLAAFTTTPSPGARRWRRGWKAALAASLLLGGVVAVQAISGERAGAAGPRPDFQLPFPCGQQWRLDSWASDHAPALDMVKEPNQVGTEGAVLVAPADGTVNQSFRHSRAGNMVQINHGGSWFTTYIHLQSRSVSVGQRVVKGQQIGRVGKDGATSNGHPHLHFELAIDTNGDGRATWGAENTERVPPWFNGVQYSTGGGQTFRNVTSRNCGGAGTPGLGVLDFHLSDDPASSVSTRPVIQYGQSPMVPIVGDWDGNGTDTVSTYDPTSARFFISNNPATGNAEHAFPYGNAGAVPLVGDWDGDGKDNVGVRMGNTFFLRTSPVTSTTETTISVAFGDAPDTPAIGDWDGDGTDNVGVYKPGAAGFYLRQTANTNPTETTVVVPYGNAGATPLVGDWNGDGKDNVGVRMGTTYFFRTSEVGNTAETTSSVAYGNGANEYPIVGDWNGDNRDTQGIVF